MRLTSFLFKWVISKRLKYWLFLYCFHLATYNFTCSLVLVFLDVLCLADDNTIDISHEFYSYDFFDKII